MNRRGSIIVIAPPRKELLLPCEVMLALGLTANGVARYRQAGYLLAVQTPGGTHRYTRDSVHLAALAMGLSWPRQEADIEEAVS